MGYRFALKNDLQEPSLGSGFQVPFSGRIRKEANVLTATVGCITDPAHAVELSILRKERNRP